jgi:hypothetical protein
MFSRQVSAEQVAIGIRTEQQQWKSKHDTAQEMVCMAMSIIGTSPD